MANTLNNIDTLINACFAYPDSDARFLEFMQCFIPFLVAGLGPLAPDSEAIDTAVYLASAQFRASFRSPRLWRLSYPAYFYAIACACLVEIVGPGEMTALWSILLGINAEVDPHNSASWREVNIMFFMGAQSLDPCCRALFFSLLVNAFRKKEIFSFEWLSGVSGARAHAECVEKLQKVLRRALGLDGEMRLGVRGT